MEVAEKNTLFLRVEVKGRFWCSKSLPLKASVYIFLPLSQNFPMQADFFPFSSLSQGETVQGFQSFFGN